MEGVKANLKQPEKGAGKNETPRKRTPSVEIELRRLHELNKSKLYEHTEASEKMEEYLADHDSKITPLSLVLAANAIVLGKEGDVEKMEGVSYKKDIENELPDSVNIAMKGMIVDLNQLIENYKFEIMMLDRRCRERVKNIWSQIPQMTTAIRKAAKFGASTVVSGTVWGAIYFLLKDYAGQWGAALGGAAIAGAAFYATTKKGAEFLSAIGQHVDYALTSLSKRMICSIYANRKVGKLLTLGKILNQELGAGEKQSKEDREIIKSMGKTMPSPFEEELDERRL
ncbi:hypothetical protein H0O02_05595 [Candidatus Micrarchaeota archaeon]|nr:hypothetical protein [Candidatus Micrarchaeota archaeon]